MTINLLGRDAVFGLGDEAIDEDAGKIGDIPFHAFDSIIADECHRGYTSSEFAIWRQTIEHFDAVKIGLTATPAEHTTAYFKDVVFRYEYERAVREGFLVDYDVVAVKSNVRLNGIFLKEGEEVGLVDARLARRSSISWKTSASSTPPRSRERSRHPIQTGKSSKRSKSMPPSMKSAMAGFPRP